MGNTAPRSQPHPAQPVHPHGRGEHACASTPSTTPTVHPHGRGEHVTKPSADGLLYGSSPRAWGTLKATDGYADPARFIPTGVGNTHLHAVIELHQTVHPHGRGEHAIAFVAAIHAPGSSPRAWGTRNCIVCALFLERFIPTGVGNTTNCRSGYRDVPVHPHGRGEHSHCRRTAARTRGSSPRAWGTLIAAGYCCRSARFIPTGVGNTGSACLMRYLPTVHPHGRGEHQLIVSGADRIYGSSPRAWGTPRPGPACPGCRTVHPHGRGEHVSLRFDNAWESGSSPRAWGTR